MRERSFMAQPLDVLPGRDEQLCRHYAAHAQQRGGARRDALDQARQVLVEAGDLGLEGQDALGQAAQGQFGSLQRLVQVSLVSAQASAEGGPGMHDWSPCRGARVIPPGR